MGAGASTIPSEVNADGAKVLKEKYEELEKAGMTDEEIRSKLSNEYQHLLKPAAAAAPVEASHAPTKGTGLQKFNGKHGGGGGKGPTRRRSFDSSKAKDSTDGADAKLASKSEAVLPSVSAAAEAAAIISAATTTVPDKVDTWDSVTQQPFCTVCHMAFKSEAFLDRHLKFSDLHARNVKRANTTKEGHAAEHAAQVAADAPVVKPLPNKQVEGEDFKMLYTGSKLFWRTSENIDLHFYHHILPHTIEIIAYDAAKGKELNRIYLDYSLLYDRLMATHADFRDATCHHPHDTEEEVDEEHRQREVEARRTTLLTTHILQHLQLSSSSSATIDVEGAGNGGTTIFYANLGSDGSMKSPLMGKPPSVLIPVVVTRRRRTNAEEIEATMHNLVEDRAAISEATQKAERIALLVYGMVNLMATKKWYTHLNPVRQRWIRAIRLVIRQRLVADTKKVLAARDEKIKRRQRAVAH